MNNKLRRLRYNAVLKATNDPALARAARSWSNARIFNTYNVTINVTTIPDYNKQRRIKYNYVLSITGDVELARAARSLSLKTIEERLKINTYYKYRNRTVTILERPPKKVKLTPRQRKNRQKRYDDYINWTGGAVPIPPPPEGGGNDDYDGGITGTVFHFMLDQREIEEHELFKDKIENWAHWSQDRSHPSTIKTVARIANRDVGKDSGDSYGYAVVYYMYTENMTYNEVIKYITPNRLIADYYEDDLRHLIYKN